MVELEIINSRRPTIRMIFVFTLDFNFQSRDCHTFAWGTSSRERSRTHEQSQVIIVLCFLEKKGRPQMLKKGTKLTV